ncbi:MAG: hypothetical protein LBP59_10435 [Planctomycetaceae bacterium]|jgi:hypothetical protein|nr:hypothetical protein [Planctomycetaceae bacterium]
MKDVCKFRVAVEPSELYHELRPCKREAVLCSEPTVTGKSGQLLRRSVMDCSPLVCPLFEPQQNNKKQ